MSALNLEIISASGPVFSGQYYRVTVPCVDGDIGFMPNHESVISKIREGQIVIQDEKETVIKELDAKSGYAEMIDNKLIILLD